MKEILNTPFFLGLFPNSESLRWSCGCFSEIDRTVPISKLPRKLFESSLPHLQKLSMVNFWGLATTDTGVEGGVNRMHRRDESSRDFRPPTCPLALSSTIPRLLVLDQLPHRSQREPPPGPVSMKKLKEVTLRKVGDGVVSHYIRCPSIHHVRSRPSKLRCSRRLFGPIAEL